MHTKNKALKFWIIGGGKFGFRAAEGLIRKHPNIEITIIEKDIKTCRRLKKQAFHTVCLEGIRFLEQDLRHPDKPDWIVPAIPLHVVYEWIKAKLSKNYELLAVDIPVDLKKVLPNPFDGDRGQLYISNVDFICPENCSEPDEFCTATGKPRPRILHQFLAGIRYKPFKSVVICSHQLAPGVGGYQPRSLFDALDSLKTSHSPVLLSTACRCHGVLNAFNIIKKTAA
jgi:hypothetical protein